MEDRSHFLSTSSGAQSLPDEASADDHFLIPCQFVEVDSEAMSTEKTLQALVQERIKILHDSAGVHAVTDDEVVDQQDLKAAFQRVLNGIKINERERSIIEERTHGQSDNPLWMAERAGRITASMVHKVFKRKARTPPDNLVRSILMYDINSKIVLRKNDPREHGRLMEPVAREAYIACSDSCRIVSENGLYVHLEKPYLAASPDGIVVDESEENPGLLEIKCPMSKLLVDA